MTASTAARSAGDASGPMTCRSIVVECTAQAPRVRSSATRRRRSGKTCSPRHPARFLPGPGAFLNRICKANRGIALLASGQPFRLTPLTVVSLGWARRRPMNPVSHLSHLPRRADVARTALAAALALALAVAAASTGIAPARAALNLPTGLSQLVAAYKPGKVTTAIATFDANPTAVQATALRALGLSVQRLDHLPLALVYGPVAAMQSAVTTGAAIDVYPDEPIELLDTFSSDAMG